MFISPFPSDVSGKYFEFERLSAAICHLFLTEEKEFGHPTMSDYIVQEQMTSILLSS